jgi:2-haloacid dehalogenase/putative hydrolase of the HAD superfamily
VNKKRPQAVLLDFFGTVVEEIHLPVKAICDRVCAVSPSHLSDLDFIQYWVGIFSRLSEESYGTKFKLQRDIERESLQAAIDHFNIDLNASELAQSLLDYRSHPLLFPESKAVLAGLDVPVCLLTNIDNAEIRTALQYTGLKFSFVVTSEDCRAYKPRPEVFRKALSLVGSAPSEVLHVGDSWQGDIQGAQALAIPVLWIDRRQKPLPSGTKPPDYTAWNLNGLTEILNSNL